MARNGGANRSPDDLARELNEALRRAGVEPLEPEPEPEPEPVLEGTPEPAHPEAIVTPEPEPVIVPEPELVVVEATAEDAVAPALVVDAPRSWGEPDAEDPSELVLAPGNEEELVEEPEPELVLEPADAAEPEAAPSPILMGPADPGPEPAPAPAPVAEPATPRPPRSEAEAAEEARLRRQRLVRRGMENLGHLPRSSGTTLNVQPIPAEPAHEEPPAPAPAPDATARPARAARSAPSATAAAEKPSGTTDEAALARLIEDKFATLTQKRDHFAVLGLPREATRDAVKAAFLSQAKVFHPDRLPAGLRHMSAKMSSVFEAVREAYELLYDDARRRDYVATLQNAQTPAEEAATNDTSRAAEDFRKGELSFRKREFLSAEESFAKAYAQEGRAEYLAARGWAIFMDPARKHEAGRAKQMMVDSLKVNPNCDRAHYQLGVIARVENDLAAAERHFREAVRANPKHTEANQELRLIEMRKRKESKRGLFK